MSEEGYLQKIETELEEAIGEWMEKRADEDGWSQMPETGNNLEHLMAKAAMLVLRAQCDLWKTAKKNGLIRD